MRRLVKKTIRKYDRDGFGGLIKATPRFLYSNIIRDILPKTTKTVSYNGIESPVRVGWLDQYIPNYSPPWYTKDIPNYEFAEVRTIRDYCDAGDKVAIVGAGFGVTAVVAANEVGPSGKVIAYEASELAFERSKRTIQHNTVEDRVELHHSIVGDAIDLKSKPGSAGILSPRQLPEVDVLELDCEGAEMEILEEMLIRPEVISVEIHPQFGSTRDSIESVLREKGYKMAEVIRKNDTEMVNLVAIRP